MQIHEISLRNIRSYEDFTISFEEGITLLSGDIGAGKSSILQAIEFSLFGIQRGGLEGESLLRHGSEEGSVSVLFSINEQEVKVTRTLKRTKDGVRQSEGKLETNGLAEALSTVELKARILQLLGYPEQLVTKSKGLIFRHTVYTPQEEMKHIIFMDAEERLNTLRILFGIEKYRTIKENSQLLLKDLRSQERYLMLQAALAPQLEREQESLAGQEQESKRLLSTRDEASNAAKQHVQKLRQELQSAQAAWERAMKHEHEQQSMHERIRELERSIKNADEDVARIDERLKLALNVVEDGSSLMEELHSKIKQKEEELLSATRRVGELRGQHKLVAEPVASITSMDFCPVCKQPVALEHKHAIREEATTRLAAMDEQISILMIAEQLLHNERTKLQEKLSNINEQQRRFAAYQKELLFRKEEESRKQHLLERQKAFALELRFARDQLTHIPVPDSKSKLVYEEATKRVSAAETAMHGQLELLSQARDSYTKLQTQLQLVSQRLADARASQLEASRIQSTRQWLEEQFLELVTTVEQHVLASIHAEFRELFQTWFSKLVEDEAIQVSLGERFEPLANQNGYDASLEQLSGGEKTAVALAYRLSLYKVVTDFISTIHTKELLILDEPTDGFSTEQLDKVKEVLRELGCSQVVLVSHEQQMEGLCDHVLRINKRGHSSGF